MITARHGYHCVVAKSGQQDIVHCIQHSWVVAEGCTCSSPGAEISRATSPTSGSACRQNEEPKIAAVAFVQAVTQVDALVAAFPIHDRGEEAHLKRISEIQSKVIVRAPRVRRRFLHLLELARLVIFPLFSVRSY